MLLDFITKYLILLLKIRIKQMRSKGIVFVLSLLLITFASCALFKANSSVEITLPKQLQKIKDSKATVISANVSENNQQKNKTTGTSNQVTVSLVESSSFSIGALTSLPPNGDGQNSKNIIQNDSEDQDEEEQGQDADLQIEQNPDDEQDTDFQDDEQLPETHSGQGQEEDDNSQEDQQLNQQQQQYVDMDQDQDQQQNVNDADQNQDSEDTTITENEGASSLDQLRALMEQRGIDVYVLPRTDQHKSQWLCPWDQRVAFISGFTGSNGVALISLDQAIVWTDGRYLVQAVNQFHQGDGWQVKKISTGQKKWWDYILDTYPQGTKIQIDGRLITASSGKARKSAFQNKGLIVQFSDSNLIDEIWEDKPQPIMKDIFVHQEWAGKGISQKVDWVRQNIKQKSAQSALFSDLTQIAWILNLRSLQFPYTPVFKSIFVLTQDGGTLFLPLQHPSMQDQQVLAHLNTQNIGIQPYPPVYPDVVLCEPDQISYQISTNIKKLVPWMGIGMYRAIRTQKQIEGFKKSNILDGVTLTKYWSWLQDQDEIEQYAALQYLQDLLAQNEGYTGPSFPTMISSGANSAIIHYFPTKDKSSVMKKDTVRFLDYGTQYLFGTTDISRAFHVGQPTKQEKDTFTRVLLGNLDVQRSRWTNQKPYSGAQLDIAARSHLKQKGLDYDHGTGHGVGYFQGVHEAPVGITKTNKVNFQQNMIVTDEPGYYQTSQYGFRIQNLLVVVKDEETGQLTFQNLTFCPYDRNLIDLSLLDDDDKSYINDYHKLVWEIISPHLDEAEDANALEWLKRYTEPL